MRTWLLLVCIIIFPRNGTSILVKITKMECEMNNKYCNNEFCSVKTLRQRVSLLNYGCNFFEQINHFLFKFTVERLFQKYEMFYEYTTDGCDFLQGSSGSPIIVRLLEKTSKYLNLPKKCPFKGNVTVINCPVDSAIFPNFFPNGNYRAILDAFSVVNQCKEEGKILEEITLALAIAKYCRYGVPFVRHCVPKSQNFFVDVLPNLDEKRFKQIARVSWANFEVLLELIKNDCIFHGPRSCMQLPIELQLILVLYRLGASGEGATVTKIASLFGIGDGGTIQIITNRVFQAIINLQHEFLYWPDDRERKILATETLSELPHCVGYVDGTEIKLAEKPSEDPEAYFSRKHIYSLKVQAVCDHKLRIRHMVLGYPGSVHDARIYNNCDLSIKAQEFLKGAEWIAGDSAYKLTTTVITPFRSNSVEGCAQERNDFNKIFSRYRVRVEHCFGIMKERFNSLKELKIQIRNDSSVKQACRWILVCSILHNILIKQKDIIEISEDCATENEHELEQDSENQDYSTAEGEVKRRALLELLKEINL